MGHLYNAVLTKELEGVICPQIGRSPAQAWGVRLVAAAESVLDHNKRKQLAYREILNGDLQVQRKMAEGLGRSDDFSACGNLSSVMRLVNLNKLDT
jgi:hypothetical protein